MPSAHARVETDHAARYVAQLCKHFAHKIEVVQIDDHALCRFPFGTARLAVRERAIDIDVEAGEAQDLERLKHVVEDHLLRFAFRENLPALSWSA